MESSKVTKDGQVTIPEVFRKKFNLQAGEIVIFYVKDGDLIIKKAVENPIEQLTGIGTEVLEKSIDYQRKVRDEWDRLK